MGERRNVTGTAYALTVFTAIIPGLEEAVRAVIENLPLGPDSPIARLGTVHTSRLQIFDRLVHQGPSQQRESLNSNYLVFTAAFDGELEPFLDAVVDRMPEADSWWRHCIAYPGLADRPAFKRWIRHNQIHTSLFAINSPNRTVPEVLESLALREKLLDFAIATQGVSERELHERFQKTFVEAR
jgi:hypothetical protein